MVTTYRLHVNELSEELLNSIKAAFKDKTVEIIVTDAVDETDYLLATEANRKSIEKSLKEVEAGELTTMTVQELEAKYGKK
jgi:hypothetical protein